ncbi:hypothetical protein [Clostridium cochlearium]|uniref:hypothetical protein n=1 Tax=Clostridium cochlearium TaxID=1494 RepID=UPI0036F4A9B3
MQKKAINNLNRLRALGENKAMVVAATGERVIIVMGAIYVIKSRVSEILTKYNSCIA